MEIHGSTYGIDAWTDLSAFEEFNFRISNIFYMHLHYYYYSLDYDVEENVSHKKLRKTCFLELFNL